MTGFVFVDGVLSGDELCQAQAAWQQVQEPVQQRWQASNASEGYFDIPNLMNAHDAFISMVDSPKLVPLLCEICGRGGLQPGATIRSTGYHGFPRLTGPVVGRVVPSEGNRDGCEPSPAQGLFSRVSTYLLL